jgi:hypothetical protein
MGAGTVFDESTRVLWFADADAPSDMEAITEVELADAVDLSAYLVPDGMSFGFGNSRVSGADLLTSFDNESMGRHQAAPSATFKRKLRGDGAELAWTTFQARKTAGTLVVFTTLDAGADPENGDDYIAFPDCETGQPLPQNTAANTEVRFQVDFAVGSQPVFGVVGGGS